MFKISDEDILSFARKSFEKVAKERGLIKEEQKGSLLDGCEKEPKWPAFQLDRMVGKKINKSAGRDIFENIPITGKTVGERVKSLQRFLEKTLDSATQQEGDLKQQFSSFIFLDTLQSLAETEMYNARAAGYLLEPIVSAIFRGEHIGSSPGLADIEIGDKELADTEISDKELEAGISLKFISEKTKVRGSFINLIMSLLSGVDTFHFVVIMKHIHKREKDRRGLRKSREEKIDTEVSLKISFFTYEVKKPLGLAYAVMEANKRYVAQRAAAKDHRPLSSAPTTPTNDAGEENEVESQGGETTRETQETNLLSGPDQETDQEKSVEILKKLSTANRTEFALILRDVLKEKEEKDFENLMSIINAASKPAIEFDISSTQSGDKIEIPSPSDLRSLAEQKISSIDESISSMYNELGKLSCIMKNYIRHSEISGPELGREVAPVATSINLSAESLLRGEQKEPERGEQKEPERGEQKEPELHGHGVQSGGMMLENRGDD